MLGPVRLMYLHTGGLFKVDQTDVGSGSSL